MTVADHDSVLYRRAKKVWHGKQRERILRQDPLLLCIPGLVSALVPALQAFELFDLDGGGTIGEPNAEHGMLTHDTAHMSQAEKSCTPSCVA